MGINAGAQGAPACTPVLCQYTFVSMSRSSTSRARHGMSSLLRHNHTTTAAFLSGRCSSSAAAVGVASPPPSLCRPPFALTPADTRTRTNLTTAAAAAPPTAAANVIQRSVMQSRRKLSPAWCAAMWWSRQSQMQHTPHKQSHPRSGRHTACSLHEERMMSSKVSKLYNPLQA